MEQEEKNFNQHEIYKEDDWKANIIILKDGICKSNKHDSSNQNEKYTQKQSEKKILKINTNLKESQKIFLVLGNKGVGKSSFIQKLKNCLSDEDGKLFKDSPGLNNFKRDNSEILLEIARDLHQNNYRPENIFIIYLYKKKNQISNKTIQELSYTYFLYEIFKQYISSQEVKQFIKEYHDSNCLLNWHEYNFHQKQDQYSEKRTKIFSHKDQALYYFQIFNSYHITVKTFFDMTADQDLKEVDANVVDSRKEQIWSNNTINLDKFDGYKEYIENQVQNFFQKLYKIIEDEDKILNLKKNKQTRYILLIGNSQVGKSSLIEQLTKIKGISGSGEYSKTLNCQCYSFDFESVEYIFIDTPGIYGTLEIQDQFHSLKIITDFLSRNNICIFKLLFLKSEIDNKDEMEQILTNFIVFLIKDMLFQDVTTIDPGQQEHDLLKFINDKVLKINLMQAQKNYNFEEIEINEHNVLNIKFQNNYITKKGELIEVNKDVDKKQQNTLFKAINQIQSISKDNLHSLCESFYKIEGQYPIQQIILKKNYQIKRKSTQSTSINYLQNKKKKFLLIKLDNSKIILN